MCKHTKNNLLLVAILVVAAMALTGCNRVGGVVDGVLSFVCGSVKITPKFTERVQQYTTLRPFSDGYAKVERDGKWGAINRRGREVVPCTLESEGEVEKGTRNLTDSGDDATEVFMENGKAGIREKDTKRVILPAEFDGLTNFSEGVAVATVKYTDFSRNYRYNELREFDAFLYYYVDAKGNSTLTDSLRQFLLDKENDLRQARREVERENEYKYTMEALKGTWELTNVEEGWSTLITIQVDDTEYRVFLDGERCGETYYYKLDLDGDPCLVLRDGSNKEIRRVAVRNKKIVLDGDPMSKISNSPNASPSRYGIRRVASTSNSRNSSSGSRCSSSSSVTSFRYIGDVHQYMFGTTWRGSGGELRIAQNGFYLNGTCVSAAPVVKQFNGQRALITAQFLPPVGTTTIIIDCARGELYQGGDTWYAQ